VARPGTRTSQDDPHTVQRGPAPRPAPLGAGGPDEPPDEPPTAGGDGLDRHHNELDCAWLSAYLDQHEGLLDHDLIVMGWPTQEAAA